MGAACCGPKSKRQLNATIIRRPVAKDFSFEDDAADEESHNNDPRIVVPPDPEQARLGVYFQFDELAAGFVREGRLSLAQARAQVVVSGRLEKWLRMASFGLDTDIAAKVILRRNRTATDPIVFSKYAKVGLTNFYETYPDLFLSRLSKGPPPQYRWLAWKVAMARKLKRAKGLYEEQLGRHSKWMHDIVKDLDRTFPGHPYFSKEQFGDAGQKALMNALQVFSVYNEKVGYCQSMNFVVGFIMMVNGGNEKEAFWLFAGLAKTSKVEPPYFEGLRGFYKKHFPLL